MKPERLAELKQLVEVPRNADVDVLLEDPSLSHNVKGEIGILSVELDDLREAATELLSAYEKLQEENERLKEVIGVVKNHYKSGRFENFGNEYARVVMALDALDSGDK